MSASDVHAGNYRGPFEGRVVDTETREPIEGAVVFVEWYINHAFSRPTFYDTAEVLTDKDGRFYIKKKWSLNPWWNLVMDSHVIVVKAGYWHDRTHWQPIIDAAEILKSLPPDEREKRGAGCDRAVGDSESILGCSAAKEQGPGERASVTGIRLQDGKPVFFLSRKLLAEQEFIDLGRDVPDHKQRLLQQEIQKIEQHPQEIPTIELRPREIPIIELHPRDERGTRRG
jgi:hypothetical protein